AAVRGHVAARDDAWSGPGAVGVDQVIAARSAGVLAEDLATAHLALARAGREGVVGLAAVRRVSVAVGETRRARERRLADEDAQRGGGVRDAVARVPRGVGVVGRRER